MQLENKNVPFIGNKEIKLKVDNLRKRLWGDKIPVDIESIIEIKLKILITPVPGFLKQFGVDALITSKFSEIYVDKDCYENESNRCRFSLAHELGHYTLHESYYKSLNLISTDDILSYYNLDDYNRSNLETQANKFANYFLVPREKLNQAKVNILRRIRNSYDISSVDEKTLNSYLANYISPKFSVSAETAEIALNDLNNYF